MSEISSLAFIHPEAQLGDNIIVEPFAFIDKDVVIGNNCHIHPHASILKGARIGKNNEIFENAIISATPQDFRWKGEDSLVIIGDNNKIREQVIINRSIYKDKATKIGNNSFIMAQSHIGHDSEIGDHCVLGNAVKIAGNVKIGNYTILSSNALVHEKCHIGDWVLIKGGCRVNNNVPPFVVMAHNPIAFHSVNSYILRLAKKSKEIIEDLDKCYRHLYLSETSIFNALQRIKDDIEPSTEIEMVVDFIVSHDEEIAGHHDNHKIK